nr:brachyurin-like [Onthophagus taurus]
MLFLFYVCLGILCCTKNVLSSLTFLKPTHLESKIVGGEEVSANSIPYMAGLFITKPSGLYLCGGVLISTKYVLTSANCLESSTSVEVRLGAHKVNQEESTQVRLTSTQFNIHGDWNSTSLTNDIATILLPSAITPNNYIKPVSLPGRADKDTTFSGEWAVVSGWGRDSDAANSMSQVLRSVDVEIMSNANCIFYYGTYVTPGHICTSGVDGVGSCRGDSGGPLIFDDQLIGIVSFASSAGCEVGWPTAYTRVTSYFEWIENHSDVVINK